MRWVGVWVWVLGCHRPVPVLAAPVVLDLDTALAPHADAAAEAWLFAQLEPLTMKSLAVDGAPGWVAWSTCTEAGCEGRVAQASTAPAGIEGGLTSVVLPAPEVPWNIDGVDVLGLGLFDLDGDGAAELLVHHGLVEPPRAAVGSRFHKLLTVYNLPGLEQSVSLELGVRGGLSEPVCTWSVAPEGAGRLLVTGTCEPASLRLCWDRRTDRFEGCPGDGAPKTSLQR